MLMESVGHFTELGTQYLGYGRIDICARSSAMNLAIAHDNQSTPTYGSCPLVFDIFVRLVLIPKETEQGGMGGGDNSVLHHLVTKLNWSEQALKLHSHGKTSSTEKF